MNQNEIPATQFIEALKEQRNTALDTAAAAIARSVVFQAEAAALRQEVENLKALHAKE